MKMIRVLFFLFPILVLSQQKFNSFREELIENKKYEYVYGFENNYAVFRTFKGKMGLIDSVGNVVIKPTYEYINNRKELKNFFEVGTTISKKYKRGYIDLKGNIKIPLEYDYVFYMDKGLIKVSKGSKYGVLDTLNHVILPIKFDDIMSHSGILFTQIGKNEELFNASGKQITNFKAKDIDYFTENKTIVTLQNNNTFIINNQGDIILNMITNHKFEKVFSSNAYLISDLTTHKKGIINSSGKYEVDCKYDDIMSSKSIYVVKNKNKSGIITKKDSILKPIIYDGIYPVSYDSIISFKDQYFVDNGNLRGVITPFSEKEIIPIRYKNIETLTNHYMTTNAEGKNGLFSENGETIINEEYEFYKVSKNKIFASKNNTNYILTFSDNNYSEIQAPVDQFVKPPFFYGNEVSNYQAFKKGNKFGVISTENKITIPCEYDKITEIYYSEEFIVKKNNKYGVVNAQNEILLDIKYDNYATMKEVVKFEIGKKETKYYPAKFHSKDYIYNSF